MTGALIGQETESGFVRGAAVGAISGAVFSIEVFESSLLLWQSDESGIGCLLYLIFTGNHLEQVLHMNRNDYYGGESTSLHLTQLWKHFKGSEQPPKSLGSSGDYNVDSIPKPSQNPEHQRQMMVPELQMQVAQGNSQGVPPFVGLSSAFSNQTSPPTQTYPLHPRQAHVLSNSHHPYLQGPNHAASTQHQAYAMRIAKERQMQQRLQLQQQHQQQFAASNALMPHVQSQSQLPMSSPMQNSSQVQPQRRTGMPRFKAHEVVTEAIQRKGLYRGAKNNEMRLGICSRSNDVVEPLIKPQWYVNCNSMAKQALDAVFDDKNRKMEIIPKQYAAEWKRSLVAELKV